MNNKEINTQYDLYKYTFIDDNNVEREYEVLMSFKSKKYKKVFFIMTDNLIGENNKLNTYAFYIYDANDDVFNPVVDQNELQYINDVFNKMKMEL